MEDPRSTHITQAYIQFKNMYKDNPKALVSFDLTQETIVREFTHWVIIKNRFPYDKMAKVNDMLVSRRAIQSHYAGNPEELDEYHSIMQLLAYEGYYDALIENFPKVKSVTRYAHTHLVIWHGSTGSN